MMVLCSQFEILPPHDDATLPNDYSYSQPFTEIGGEIQTCITGRRSAHWPLNMETALAIALIILGVLLVVFIYGEHA